MTIVKRIQVGPLVRRTFQSTGRFTVTAALLLGFVIGVATVSVGRPDLWGLLLLSGPAALVVPWYHSVRSVRRRNSNVQVLYGFSARLAELSETEAIVAAALAQCQELLSCQHVQLVLTVSGEAARWEIGEALDAESTIQVERHVLDLRSPVLAAKARSMAAPVSLGDAESGVLVVANRERPKDTFDEEHLSLLQALSAQLSTALTSSRRLEQLQTEMAAREFQALHDSLTGLANRTLFLKWITQELARRAEGRQVAVVMMDLDGFQDINDSLGHHSGDLVLRQLAARLEASGEPGRMTARLGGDEFGFVLTDLGGEDAVMAAVASIREELAEPIEMGGMALELRASIGIAVAPFHGSDPVELLQRADVAMCAAKVARRSPVLYDSQMEVGTRRRLTLGTTLRQALDTGHIEVWYQPVARSVTGSTSSCEALLRWRDGEGFIPPSEFIPIAENTGIIEKLTWWTLEKALGELSKWRGEDLCPSVAVNLSTRCLQAPETMKRVRDVLVQSDVPASALTLEITESLLMSDPDLAEELLNQLGLMGVRIAIDDFGTGYSSLSRLKRLPIDTIKIDRDFVVNMHTDHEDEAIVKATLEMARTLGCTVVAEGVETLDTWHQLQAFGCQQIQGFVLAEPMPADDCLQWLRRRKHMLDPPD